MPFPNALHNPDLHLHHHVEIVFLWHPFSLDAYRSSALSQSLETLGDAWRDTGRRPHSIPTVDGSRPRKLIPSGSPLPYLSVVQQHSHWRQRWFEGHPMKQKSRQLLLSTFTQSLSSAPGDSTFWNRHGRQIQFVLEQQRGESGWE